MENKAVLFVDDEEHILTSLKRLLPKEPDKVFTAVAGQAGLFKIGTSLVNGEFESEVGQGTTFRICLPAVTAPRQDSVPKLEPEEELIG